MGTAVATALGSAGHISFAQCDKTLPRMCNSLFGKTTNQRHFLYFQQRELEFDLHGYRYCFPQKQGGTMSRKTFWALTVASALLILLCLPSVASADSGQTWTLTDVITSDGATSSGSFVFNAGTGLYSNIDIVTLAGTELPGATYSVVDADFFSPDEVVVMANNSYAAGTPVMLMEFGADLTSAGGIVEMFAVEGYCNAGCTSFGSEDARELEGLVVTSPEPSLALLLGAGLLGLVPLRRKLVSR